MGETKIGALRLRSVRLKSGGGEIRVMHSPSKADDRRHVEQQIGKCLDLDFGRRIAGFAFVAWGPDNASVAHGEAYESSKVPNIMVPDFARERLMAALIERWTKED